MIRLNAEKKRFGVRTRPKEREGTEQGMEEIASGMDEIMLF